MKIRTDFRKFGVKFKKMRWLLDLFLGDGRTSDLSCVDSATTCPTSSGHRY